jgi:hypothetical protein
MLEGNKLKKKSPFAYQYTVWSSFSGILARHEIFSL